MNDEAARQGRPAHDLSRRFEGTTGRVLTPVQSRLVAFYLLFENAREELDPEAWRAFVWIARDYIGMEATRVVLEEAVDATSEAA